MSNLVDTERREQITTSVIILKEDLLFIDSRQAFVYCIMRVSCVWCGMVHAPVILRLEELEFLLYTVQGLQDGELERLARLQGDLYRTEIKRRRMMKNRY